MWFGGRALGVWEANFNLYYHKKKERKEGRKKKIAVGCGPVVVGLLSVLGPGFQLQHQVPPRPVNLGNL